AGGGGGAGGVGGPGREGQEPAGRGGGGVGLGGCGAGAPGRGLDGAGGGGGERAQVRRRGAVAGNGRPAAPAVVHRLWGSIMRVGAGGALDRNHVLPAAVSQLLAEGSVVPVARVSCHHPAGAARRRELVQDATSP